MIGQRRRRDSRVDTRRVEEEATVDTTGSQKEKRKDDAVFQKTVKGMRGSAASRDNGTEARSLKDADLIKEDRKEREKEERVDTDHR